MNYNHLDIGSELFSRAESLTKPSLTDSHVIEKDIDVAKAAFYSTIFQDTFATAWEQARAACIAEATKKESWVKIFSELSLEIESASKSENFLKFCSQAALPVDDVILGLPFLGAAAEEIAWEEGQGHRFFRCAADLTRQGYWVCGVHNLKEHEEYPNASFIVYQPHY